MPFFRYEDVLVDPTSFLVQLVTKYGLRRRTAYLVNVLQVACATGEIMLSSILLLNTEQLKLCCLPVPCPADFAGGSGLGAQGSAV